MFDTGETGTPVHMNARLRARVLPFVPFMFVEAVRFLSVPENWRVNQTNAVSQEDAAKQGAELFASLRIYTLAGMIAFWVSALPDGWHELDGSTFDADDYPELAAAMPSWVSSGTITLPDWRGKFTLAASTSYVLGSTGGEADHTLTVDELPAHHHAYDPVVIPDLDLEDLGLPQGNAAQITPLITENTYDTGGGEAHNNMPPYIALTMAVALW